MELPIQLMCSECGRSVEWSGHRPSEIPDECAFCGGPVEGMSDVSPASGHPPRTPSSLELSPEGELTGIWTRGEPRDLPESIGRFRVRRFIGGGGFGHVYHAFDPRMDRDVALKVLRDDRPPARVVERFFREARAAAQLDHPHIVPIHDAGRDDGRCWIAYQYIPGLTLSQARDERNLDVRRSVEIIRDLADALDHCHARGIFHRDVKPANVILDASGRARLTDFGLARRVDFEPTMTCDGAILGTPAYMSPEAAAGQSHRVDARSDLYSLGVMLFELLCGRRPADLPSGVPPWRAAPRVPIQPPRALDPKIPRELDRICSRALAIDPNARYADARSLSRDLDAWLGRRQAARPLLRTGIAASAVIVAAFAAGGLRSPRAIPPNPAPAEAGLTVARAAAAPAIPFAEGAPQSPREGTSDEFEAEGYVGNTDSRSHRLHTPGCKSVEAMNPSNRVEFSTIREALERGYKPHSQCLPDVAAELRKGLIESP